MADVVPDGGPHSNGPTLSNGGGATSIGNAVGPGASQPGMSPPVSCPAGKPPSRTRFDSSASRPCDSSPDSVQPPDGSPGGGSFPGSFPGRSYDAAQTPGSTPGDSTAGNSTASSTVGDGPADGGAADGLGAVAMGVPVANGEPASSAPLATHTVAASSPPAAPHGESMLPAVIRDALRRASNRRTLSLEHNVHKEFNNGDTYQGAAPASSICILHLRLRISACIINGSPWQEALCTRF